MKTQSNAFSNFDLFFAQSSERFGRKEYESHSSETLDQISSIPPDSYALSVINYMHRIAKRDGVIPKDQPLGQTVQMLNSGEL